MKIGIVPDVHQTTYFIDWLEDNIDSLDKIIFLGDYVDNWSASLWWRIPEHNPINIVNKIISYKQKYFDKIDLLLGNHCLSYLSQGPFSKNVSGHQHIHDEEIARAYLKNIDLFKIAVEYDGWVFSHAGFSNTWVNNQKERGWDNKKENIIDWCNRMILEENFHYFDWTGVVSSSGDEIMQTPTWIRPFSLIKDSYFKNQLVGHSEAKFAPLYIKNKKTKLILADSPEHTAFLIFDANNLPEFKTVTETLRDIKRKEKEINDLRAKANNKI